MHAIFCLLRLCATYGSRSQVHGLRFTVYDFWPVVSGLPFVARDMLPVTRSS